MTHHHLQHAKHAAMIDFLAHVPLLELSSGVYGSLGSHFSKLIIDHKATAICFIQGWSRVYKKSSFKAIACYTSVGRPRSTSKAEKPLRLRTGQAIILVALRSVENAI